MSFVLHEASEIIKTLDADNADQIAIDRSNNGYTGFNLGAYGKGSKSDKIEQEKKLIRTWRDLSQLPKVENALMDIWNEAVVADSRHPVSVDTSEIELSNEKKNEAVKEAVENAFSLILKEMRFRSAGTKIFKDWYVDGRLYVYYETKNGHITEIRFLDPMKIKLIQEDKNSYYEYIPDDAITINGQRVEKAKIPAKQVIFIPSGLKSADGIWLSYLNKAVRPLSLLQMLENSLVIHRFVRAPERWVFRVDVSNMNKKRAKTFINNMVSKYRSKYQIDPVSGNVNAQNTLLAMQENIFLPKTNSQNGGHEIDSIGGNASFGDIDDILYWKDEVSASLNLPQSKDTEAMFNFGSRLEEISRAEHRWFRFIKFLRSYFNMLFTKLIGIELVENKTMTKDEFDEIDDDIYYVYENDSIYEEAKKFSKIEMVLEKLSTYGEVIEKWFGPEWAYDNIIPCTKEEKTKYMKHREEFEKNNQDGY